MRHGKTLGGLFAAILSVLAVDAVAETKTPPFKDGFPVTSRQAIYPFDALKVGDQGIGYTVFRGHEVKPFGFEVLGIMRAMLGPHRHIILARLTGKDIEYTGVIAGMSGSPVYIDGKLVGAVSYRFGTFSKEPIAGITPIGSMLEIYEKSDIGPVSSHRGSGRTQAQTLSRTDFRSRTNTDLLPLPERGIASGPEDLRPIATPILLSGLTPRAREALEAALEGTGTMVAAGGLGGEAGRTSPRERGRVHDNVYSVAGGVRAAPIAPGAPIAAVLMRGDIYVAGTGTVTFLEGNTVLGFGHPFFGYGHVGFPMATAAIINTLATPLGSYKQAATGVEVGTIDHDRLTAITGELGKMARMVPAKIRVRQRARPSKEITTNVEIVDHESWMPPMLQSALASASSGRLGAESGGTIDFEARITVGDRTLGFSDTYSTAAPIPVGGLVARDVAGTTSMILQSAIAKAEVKSIEVVMTESAEPEFSYVERVVPSHRNVRPGQDLELRVTLRPFRGAPKVVAIRATVPKDAEGVITVYVGGAVEVDQHDDTVRGARVPEDLDDLLGMLADRRPGRGLYARMSFPRPGLTSNVEHWPSLPLSERVKLSSPDDLRRHPVAKSLGPAFSRTVKDVVVGALSTTLNVVQ